MLRRFNLTGSDENFEDPPRPFIEHLIDLRTCLIRCVLSWLGATTFMACISPYVRDWLVAPFKSVADKYDVSLEGLELITGVSVIVKIALWGGVALAFPLLVFFISRFIFPGLKPSERHLIAFGLFASAFLFAGGVAMGYGMTLDVAFTVLMQINEWVGVKVTILRLDNYIDMVLKTILAFGLAFQMPLMLLILGWIGIVSAQTLRDVRRYSVVVIFIIAMVLTPPDPISQIIMAVPMCLLYEVCILLIALRHPTKKKPEEDTPPEDPQPDAFTEARQS